jgi:tripartite-type tricarboxylate transporter receptor subunit TctC
MNVLYRLLALLLVAAIPVAASAQVYPAKPIRLIVPFPAGGPADIFGRFLAQGMSAHLGQPVVIENVSGVGGVLGVERAAKSPPDGYTLVLNSSSAVSIAPFSMAKMPYDPLKDLALITTVVRVPEVLAINPVLPVNSLAELVAYARANPGKINFGSAGSGTITHFAGEALKVEAKINLVHIPYKGAAPAVQDLLGGQVQMGVFDVPILLPHIRSGKLKALAVTGARRSRVAPEMPTVAEAGVPGFEFDVWYGMMVPGGTPRAIVMKANAEIVKLLKSPALSERYAAGGMEPLSSTPEEFADRIKREIPRWHRVVKEANIRVE